MRAALVFKNKKDLTIPNHTDINEKIKASLKWTSSDNTYYAQMKLCEPDYDYLVTNTVNPTPLEECFQIPDGLLFSSEGIL